MLVADNRSGKDSGEGVFIVRKLNGERLRKKMEDILSGR